MGQLSTKRTGRITSGDIYLLTGIGTREMTAEEKEAHKKENPGSRITTIHSPEVTLAPFDNYVEECIAERFFKQTLERDVEVLAMAWGKTCEQIVHNILPQSYIFHSDETMVHPDIADWAGTPDGSKRHRSQRLRALLKRLGNRDIETVTDMKCPLTRKSFFHLIKPLYHFDGFKARKKKMSEVDGLAAIQYVRDNHKDGNKFYWQLVSNACITGARFAELIIFMPYKEELDLIRAHNVNDNAEPNFLIANAKDNELPYIHKKSGVKNLNIIRFEVPQADKDFLTMRVKMAVEKIYEEWE